MKAFKFIAEQVEVPDVGMYSGCATVALGSTVEEARQAIHSWAKLESTPDQLIDSRWIDYAPYTEVELALGAVLLFVMQ